jgi:hypothetical protein
MECILDEVNQGQHRQSRSPARNREISVYRPPVVSETNALPGLRKLPGFSRAFRDRCGQALTEIWFASRAGQA